MIINTLTPTQLTHNVLNNNNTTMSSPILQNLTADKAIIVDQSNKKSFIKVNKFNLNEWFKGITIDLRYLNNEIIEDIAIEDVKPGTVFGNGIVLNMDAPTWSDNLKTRVVQQLNYLLGSELFTPDQINLAQLDDQITIEIVRSVYFTGTLVVTV